MGAMTMNYRVHDKAMLEGLKAGDMVEFSANQIDGAYTVTSLKRKP
jgi:Cu/Ag efflux protein CusF